jgi:uncharacterized phage protein (TIGR01671 family)
MTNRETIKFRVWDTKQKCYLRYYDVNVWHESPLLNDIFENERMVFQQYTGVKDRAGVEIYEGDIIKYGMSYDQEKPLPKLRFVEFYEPQLIYKIVEVGDHPVSVDYLYEAIGASTRWCEVIGNIFENPELLKA